MIVNVKELLMRPLKDEVIIFQTDTVYGIGCLLRSEKAVEAIYEIKKRDGHKPLAILCASIEDVKSLVQDADVVEPYASTYWPGALTLIVPKSEMVPDYVTSGLSSVGVRIPNDEVALQILRRFGPMAVTSLNLSTEPPITKYKDVLHYLGVVDYIVEGTDLNGISSTVFDPVSKKVFRQGDITIT